SKASSGQKIKPSSQNSIYRAHGPLEPLTFVRPCSHLILDGIICFIFIDYAIVRPPVWPSPAPDRAFQKSQSSRSDIVTTLVATYQPQERHARATPRLRPFAPPAAFLTVRLLQSPTASL